MKNQNKLTKTRDLVVVYLVILTVAGLATIASSYVVKKLRLSEKQSPLPTPAIISPSQYPDYDAIKGKDPDKTINLIKFTDSCPEFGCKNDTPANIDFDGIKKEYKVTGKISRGYLYIEVAVDDNRPLTNYDDFYFTINYIAGHLVPESNQLPVPPSNISRYLFDLRYVPYRSNSIKIADLLSVISKSQTIKIHASVSSNRPGRLIKEVSLYYQCATGSECNIEEIKK